MTNLTEDIIRSVGSQYTLRTWIEYGFKQVNNELGWHDYRLTDFASIERWWELIFSAYLLVSLHAEQFKQHQRTQDNHETQPELHSLPFSKHYDSDQIGHAGTGQRNGSFGGSCESGGNRYLGNRGETIRMISSHLER